MGLGTASDRLRLRSLPVAEAYELLSGRPSRVTAAHWHPDYPLDATYEALTLLTGGFEAQGESVPLAPEWWIHQIVLDGQVVGDIGFHGPPADEVAEIGYAVVPAWWGHGLATWACGEILQVAWRAGAESVRAEVELENLGSQTVLLRNGFARMAAGATDPDWPAERSGSGRAGSEATGPMSFAISRPVSS